MQLFAPADPEASVLAAEQRQQIVNALTSLNPREREAIENIYFDGAKVKEVGASFGVSHTRVGQIRDKAIRKLRKRLSNYFGIKQSYPQPVPQPSAQINGNPKWLSAKQASQRPEYVPCPSERAQDRQRIEFAFRAMEDEWLKAVRPRFSIDEAQAGHVFALAEMMFQVHPLAFGYQVLPVKGD